MILCYIIRCLFFSGNRCGINKWVEGPRKRDWENFDKLKAHLPELFYLNFTPVFSWIFTPQWLYAIDSGKF